MAHQRASLAFLALVGALLLSSGVAAAQTTPGPQPLADLTLTKTASPSPVGTGETLTYTLTVRNQGPSASSSVRVVDSLPAGVTFSAAAAGCTLTGTNVVCQSSGLAPGAITVFSFSVVVTATTGTIFNTAIVDPDNVVPETDEGNNFASISTPIRVPSATGTPAPTSTAGPSPTSTVTPTPSLVPSLTPPMSGAAGFEVIFERTATAFALTPTAVPPTPSPNVEAPPSPPPAVTTPQPPPAPPPASTPAPAGQLWLQIVAPTDAFSVDMTLLWTARPGEWYVVVREEEGWALAIWEGDTPDWSVWIPIDDRVQRVIVSQPATDPPVP